MPNEKIDKLKEREIQVNHDLLGNSERLKELRKNRDRTQDKNQREQIEREIYKLEVNSEAMEYRLGAIGELLEMCGSEGDSILGKNIEVNNKREVKSRKMLNVYESNNSSEEDNVLNNTIQNNKRHSERTHKLINDSYGTFKKVGEDGKELTTDKKEEAIKWCFRGLQITAFLVALTSFSLAIAGRVSPPSPKKNALALGDDELPLTEDTNPSLLDTGYDGVLAANMAAGAGDATPSEPTVAELENLMDSLLINKSVIASGKIQQNTLWQNLASVAEIKDLEALSTSLMLIQESAVDLQGAEDFFWLDVSDATERHKALHDAYKKSGKLPDVFLAATKLEYNGEEVPPSHTAMLLQFALGQIKHDLMFHETVA
ncbi:MAG TPA: hypothetical protein VF679_06910, partial [Pedobacter sp.]